MPASSHPRSAAGRKPWLRLVLWALPIFFVLLIVAFFAVRAAIDSYLRSEGFRKFVAEKAGNTLHADSELAPLHFSGSEIFADGFRAKGGREAAFADLQLEQIRTEISLRRFFEKVWQVEHFEVQRLRVDLTGPRSDRPVEPTANPLEAPKTERASESNGWLPNRVELGRAVVRDTQIVWPGGGLRGTLLNLRPHEGALNTEISRHSTSPASSSAIARRRFSSTAPNSANPTAVPCRRQARSISKSSSTSASHS